MKQSNLFAEQDRLFAKQQDLFAKLERFCETIEFICGTGPVICETTEFVCETEFYQGMFSTEYDRFFFSPELVSFDDLNCRPAASTDLIWAKFRNSRFVIFESNSKK